MKLADLVKHPNVEKVELSRSINPENGSFVASILVPREKNTMILDVALDPETLETTGELVWYNEIDRGASEPTFSDEGAFSIGLLSLVIETKSI